MQKEYIERAHVLKFMNALYEHHLTMRNYSADSATLDCMSIVTNAPAAEVVEVVHGRWEYVTRRYEAWTHRCSECGEIMTTQIGRQANYCHNCGAKMDKEE